LNNFRKTCFFCNIDPQETRKPYFFAIAIDRIGCKDHLGGLPGEQNYQIGAHIAKAQTFLVFCFDCYIKNFPRSAERLSSDLSGIRKTQTPHVTTIITPEVYQSLIEEMGKKEADKLIIELGASIRPLNL
jgi:hypothetical protein